MRLEKLNSTVLKYLIEQPLDVGDPLPTLVDISNDMGVSVGKLREEMGIARALGIVSVKPRVGTRREAFSFVPSLLQSVLFAIATDAMTFEQLSQVRTSLESSLWETAVAALQAEDIAQLAAICKAARGKLTQPRIQIPYIEHRQFHMLIFSRIDNPLVSGLLEVYWDVYDASEFGRFQTLDYLKKVWRYHEMIVAALQRGDPEKGHEFLVEHFNLLDTTISKI